jgi:hypothetical protein
MGEKNSKNRSSQNCKGALHCMRERRLRIILSTLLHSARDGINIPTLLRTSLQYQIVQTLSTLSKCSKVCSKLIIQKVLVLLIRGDIHSLSQFTRQNRPFSPFVKYAYLFIVAFDSSSRFLVLLLAIRISCNHLAYTCFATLDLILRRLPSQFTCVTHPVKTVLCDDLLCCSLSYEIGRGLSMITDKWSAAIRT